MPKDEGVIRYLMKEMDPSEEIEFERCMMEDDNLLIEVESLRQVLKKTNQLPRLNPPQNLTEHITRKAATYRQKQLLSFRIQQIPYIQYAAAAVIIVAFGITYSISLNNGNSVTEEATEMVLPQEVAQKPQVQQNSAQPVLNGISSVNRAAVTESPDPWIDRNNMIRFAEGSAGISESSNTAFQQELQSSYEKLTRIEDSIFAPGTRIPSIQYTGSRN